MAARAAAPKAQFTLMMLQTACTSFNKRFIAVYRKGLSWFVSSSLRLLISSSLSLFIFLSLSLLVPFSLSLFVSLSLRLSPIRVIRVPKWTPIWWAHSWAFMERKVEEFRRKNNNFERFFRDSTLTSLTFENTFRLPILPTRRVVLLRRREI